MTESTRTADPTVREVPLADGGELELKLGSNRVRIRTTGGDRVIIRGRTEHDLERDVEIASGQGWVRVTDGPAGSFRLGPLTVRSGGHTPDLDIEVPRNVRISARTLSGSIEAVGIAAPSRWQSASGSIRIGAESGPLTIETMSGDAYVDAHGPLALTARTVSGNVKVRASRLTALDAATTSGDITVDAALDAGGVHTFTSVSGDVRLITGSEVTVGFQSVTGDIKVSMPHRIDGARGRRTVVVGSGRVKVEVKTMSGDVKLKPGEPDLDPSSNGPTTAPRASAWADFSKDWAESAKDWAESWKDWGKSWGEAWASGKAYAGSQPDAPAAPTPPVPPTPPVAPVPPAPPVHSAEVNMTPDDFVANGTAFAADTNADDTAPVAPLTQADVDAARLEILRALEREELDVETASERLAALEGLGNGAA